MQESLNINCQMVHSIRRNRIIFQNEGLVKTRYTLPVTFRLNNDTTKTNNK